MVFGPKTQGFDAGEQSSCPEEVKKKTKDYHPVNECSCPESSS